MSYRSSALGRLGALLVFAAWALLQPAAAQPLVPGESYPIPAPQDVSRPGVIAMQVDATDVARRIVRVVQRIPVADAGRLTLLFPLWIPGEHGPRGDFAPIAGLMAEAHGQRLAWQRDATQPLAIHLDVPASADEVTVRYHYLAPHLTSQGPLTVTPQMMALPWTHLTLYPAGHHASQIRVQPSLKVPAGWAVASALRDAQGARPRPGADGWLAFGEASLETLMDSPVFAAPHARQVALDAPGAAQPITLHLLGSDEAAIRIGDAQVQAFRQLVKQTDALFGMRPFRHYDFLVGVAEGWGGKALEHQESTELLVPPSFLTAVGENTEHSTNAVHEFFHAWNGRFRRPADLWTPNYNVPMRNSMLWLYEGMTQYWGHVLAARSGIATPAQMRDLLADYAAWYGVRSGRRWRNLQDTTYAYALPQRENLIWKDEQRGHADYYSESELIWLEVDALIREQSDGQRSLDDFCRRFFGAPLTRHPDGSTRPLTYTFDDVVQALHAVQAYDWASLLRTRLDSHEPGAPLQGLARAGWQVVWGDTPLASLSAGIPPDEREHDFYHSLGLNLDAEGRPQRIVWGGPAFNAAIVYSDVVVGVNGEAYSEAALNAALAANRDGRAPIALRLKNGGQERTVAFDWRGGPRHPRLARIEGTPDRLAQIYAPLK